MHTEILTPLERRLRDAEHLIRLSIRQEDTERRHLAVMQDIETHDGAEFRALHKQAEAVYLASKQLREEMQAAWRELLKIPLVKLP